MRSEKAMLETANVAPRLPVQDLERAKAFYAERLGLKPVEEREGGLRYVCAAGEFALFESAGTASGNHTQMAFEVVDIEATVRERRARRLVSRQRRQRARNWPAGSRLRRFDSLHAPASDGLGSPRPERVVATREGNALIVSSRWTLRATRGSDSRSRKQRVWPRTP